MNPLGLNGGSLRSRVSAYALILALFAILPIPLLAQGQGETAAGEWQAPAWLMGPDQAAEFNKRERSKAEAPLRSISPSSAEREQLKRLVAYYFSLMTHEDNTDLPSDVTDKLIGPSTALNPLTTERAREVLLEDCLVKARDLLNHPSPLVRTNAITLIASMSSKPADIAKGTPPAPFTGSLNLLVEVVQDSNQILQARIPAAAGLERLCREAQLSPGQRSMVSRALCSALDQVPVTGHDGNRWMRWRVTMALGRVDEFNNPETNTPIVFEKLMAVLANRKEIYLVRAEAALSISRLPLGSNANLPLVIHETCQLVQEMNQGYAKKMNSATWPLAYTRIYLAFKPENAQLAARNIGFINQVQRSGLSTHSKLVDDAFKIFVPIYKAVWDGANPLPIPAASEKALEKFLADNPVADRRPTPTSSPLGGAGLPQGNQPGVQPVPNPSDPGKPGAE